MSRISLTTFQAVIKPNLGRSTVADSGPDQDAGLAHARCFLGLLPCIAGVHVATPVLAAPSAYEPRQCANDNAEGGLPFVTWSDPDPDHGHCLQVLAPKDLRPAQQRLLDDAAPRTGVRVAGNECFRLTLRLHICSGKIGPSRLG